MRKKTLSLGIIVLAIGFSFNSAFALTHIETADEAIKLTKEAGDYGKFSISMPNGNTSTLWFQRYETEQMEGNFKILVNNLWDQAQKGNTGFVLALDTKHQQWQADALSGSLQIKDRAASMFYDKLYQSYILIWNSPSRQITTTGGNNNSNNQNNNPHVNNNNRTFTVHSTYETISGKTYTIWKSNDNRYRFNKSSSNGFRNLTDIKNFLEYQNRLIYQAPNGRMYGIFKYNGGYYFNRDEGSVSQNSRSTINDVKAYIDQHNLVLPECPRAREWRCIR